MIRSKIYLTTLIIISICISQLISPIMVRADGETDPQPTETGEVTTPLEPTDVVGETVEVEAADAASTPDPTQLIPEPAETSTPETTTGNEVEAVSGTVLEVLEDLPAETSIIVLDEMGQVEPLATEAAAEAILIGDPVWCPGTQAPTPGANGCSGSFGSLSALVAGFIPTGNGTIWIQSGVDSGTAVTIDGSVGGAWEAARNFNITLQGGWNGISGDRTIGTNSIFDTSVSIANWNNTITINNLTFDGVGASASYNDSQDININNSEFKNTNANGLSIQDSGNIMISGSNFDSNGDIGLGIWNSGNITISGSSFSGNGNGVIDDGGVAIVDSYDVTISGSTFSGNNGDEALGIWRSNNIILVNSIFDSNDNHGANIFMVNDVSISGSTFTGNGNGDPDDNGLAIKDSHDVTISDSAFNGNSEEGALIDDVNSVSILGSTFSGNVFGASIFDTSNVVVSDSGFGDNYSDGAVIWRGDNVTMSNSTFNDNDWHGADIQDVSNVSISNSVFSGNLYLGVGILDASGDISISGSTFNGNGDVGAWLDTVNNVSISNSVFSGNHSYGAWFEDTFSVYIGNSIFKDNGNSAIYYYIDPSYSPGSVFQLTLECNQYQNNPSNLEMVGDATLTEIHCEHAPRKPVGPIIIVITVPSDADHIEFEMECFDSEIYRVEWANGDKMELSCVPEARVRISRLDNTDLTKDLPAGFGYMTSYNIELFQNGTPVEMMPSNGSVQLSFADKDEGAQYGIMYWNEKTSNWIVLNEFQQNTNGTSVVFPLNASDPMDGYKILRGVQHIETQNPHREQVATNFTGIFVLVQR